MTVTYSPHSRECYDPVPSFRGGVVPAGALESHARCPGVHHDAPFGPDCGGGDLCACTCQCECHTPQGLPDWKRPQSGEALDAARALERKIRERAEAIRRLYPVLPGGRLADVAQMITLPGEPA